MSLADSKFTLWGEIFEKMNKNILYNAATSTAVAIFFARLARVACDFL